MTDITLLPNKTGNAMCAVVFAYHDVGVRCLRVLLSQGVRIALVITHQDNPQETIFFESVINLCIEHKIAYITPSFASTEAPDWHELAQRIRGLHPDILFSFYYRYMLPATILDCAPMGAFNMHGSLLPKYRGRAPVNWAVLHGETQTGATLHKMVSKPDAGGIVAQQAVPISPDDTAEDVFAKVVDAAEATLLQAMPAIKARDISLVENDLKNGSYFGGRTAADGLIDWKQPAQTVYNLVRAVAPPYPGAWTILSSRHLVVAKARLLTDEWLQANRHALDGLAPGINIINQKIVGVCGDRHGLDIISLLDDHRPLSIVELQTLIDQSL